MFMENKQKEIDDYKNMYKNIYFYYEESYLQCFFSFWSMNVNVNVFQYSFRSVTSFIGVPNRLHERS